MPRRKSLICKGPVRPASMTPCPDQLQCLRKARSSLTSEPEEPAQEAVRLPPEAKPFPDRPDPTLEAGQIRDADQRRIRFVRAEGSANGAAEILRSLEQVNDNATIEIDPRHLYSQLSRSRSR